MLLLADDPGFVAVALARLSAAGHHALAPLVPSESAALCSLPDRRVLSELEAAGRALAARPGVDARRIAVMGFGAGGRLALLLGCTSTLPAAVALVHGAFLERELSAERPVQPLELLLNLTCPLVACFGGADPALPRADVELLRAALLQGGKLFELLVLDEAGADFFDPRRPGYHAASAEAAWQKALSFLAEVL